MFSYQLLANIFAIPKNADAKAEYRVWGEYESSTFSGGGFPPGTEAPILYSDKNQKNGEYSVLNLKRILIERFYHENFGTQAAHIEHPCGNPELATRKMSEAVDFLVSEIDFEQPLREILWSALFEGGREVVWQEYHLGRSLKAHIFHATEEYYEDEEVTTIFDPKKISKSDLLKRITHHISSIIGLTNRKNIWWADHLGQTFVQSTIEKLHERSILMRAEKTFLKEAKKLTQKKEWSGLLAVAKARENLLFNSSAYWKLVGNAYRELGLQTGDFEEHKKAFASFASALRIDPNDIESIRLLGSSSFLMSDVEKFTEFLAKTFESMTDKVQKEVAEYLNRSWQGYMNFGKELPIPVLAKLQMVQLESENEFAKRMKEIGISESTDLVSALSASLKHNDSQLFSHILSSKFGEDGRYDHKDLMKIILDALNAKFIRFEAVPKQLQNEVVASAALT